MSAAPSHRGADFDAFEVSGLRPCLPPECLYHGTYDPAQREHYRAAVVSKYRPHVVALVRRRCFRSADWSDAEQAGFEGLLVALDKFEPARGAAFWGFAVGEVRHQIGRVLDQRLYFKPRNRENATKLDRQRERATSGAAVEGVGETTKNRLHVDLSIALRSDFDTEGTVADAEAADKLRAFLATLDPRDVALLLCPKRRREGRSENWRARRYEILVEQAAEFMKGDWEK